MKFVSALSLSLFLATAALAQSTPVITTIAPAQAPTTGGTTVVITGSGFNTTIQCIVPCPTTVTFDKATVVPAEASDTRLVVAAPAHAAGKVDVTVRTGDGRSTTAAAAFTYVATQEASFTPILLPIYTDGKVAGANDTMWQSDLWLHNSGSVALELAPWVCPDGGACPAVFPLRQTVPPGGTIHNLPVYFKVPTANPGRVIFATRELADRLAIQLRTADVNRATLNAGTELPAVRERDLQIAALDLLNVPFDAAFRVMLRVYDLQNTSSRFRVSVFEQSTTPGAALHTFEIEASTNETGEFRTQPAYGQFSLDTLRDLKRTWPTALRLRVEPLTDGSRFWAFASITNNETQLVTTVTPQ